MVHRLRTTKTENGKDRERTGETKTLSGTKRMRVKIF